MRGPGWPHLGPSEAVLELGNVDSAGRQLAPGARGVLHAESLRYL